MNGIALRLFSLCLAFSILKQRNLFLFFNSWNLLWLATFEFWSKHKITFSVHTSWTSVWLRIKLIKRGIYFKLPFFSRAKTWLTHKLWSQQITWTVFFLTFNFYPLAHNFQRRFSLVKNWNFFFSKKYARFFITTFSNHTYISKLFSSRSNFKCKFGHLMDAYVFGFQIPMLHSAIAVEKLKSQFTTRLSALMEFL